jgi:hypothetical protein
MENNQGRMDAQVDANQEKMEARIDANNENLEVFRGTVVSRMDSHQSRPVSTQE